MSCVVYWTISNSSLTVVFLFCFIVLLDINEVLNKIDFYKKYYFKLLKGVFAKNGAYSEKLSIVILLKCCNFMNLYGTTFFGMSRSSQISDMQGKRRNRSNSEGEGVA